MRNKESESKTKEREGEREVRVDGKMGREVGEAGIERERGRCSEESDREGERK